MVVDHDVVPCEEPGEFGGSDLLVVVFSVVFVFFVLLVFVVFFVLVTVLGIANSVLNSRRGQAG